MTTVADPASAAGSDVVTPTGLIGQVRVARVRREEAEHEVLALALEWATVHEVQGPCRRERDGTPTGFGDGVEEPQPSVPVPEGLRYAWERVERHLAADGAADGADGTDGADGADGADEAAGVDAGPDAAPRPLVLGVTEAVRAEEAEDDQERREWRGLPELVWDCAAPFATALGLTTRSGRILLRQALTLAHRLPRTHRHWTGGRVDTRPVKQVADAVVGQPDDVCAWVDTQLAARVRLGQAVGPVIVDRLVQEALTVLHAEELELDRQQRLQARYARVVPGQDHTEARPGPDRYGLAEFVIRGDWPDITSFDDTIAALAEALRRGDTPDACEPLEVRRSLAVGILADPVRAAVMLGHTDQPADDTPADDIPADDGTVDVDDDTAGQPTGRPAGRVTRRQRILLAVHLAADAVTGLDRTGRPWLTSTVGDWATRDDVAVLVRPVVHCGGCTTCDTYCDQRHPRHQPTSYEPTPLDRELVEISHPHCVFPYCTTPAHRSDCDHIVPFDTDDPAAGGPTCPRCNLAPLCRHHHRLKTHAGWRHRQLEPGVYTWTEPHGQTFHVNRWGTRDTTNP